MKQTMTGVALLVACVVCAGNASVYYVALTGSDQSGDGSAGKSWRTIAHAMTKVPAGQGHSVSVGAGEYYEAKFRVPEGVNVKGAGAGRTIVVAPEGVGSDDAAVKLESWPSRAWGNQTVSDLTIDGRNRSANAGMMVVGRHGVKVLRVEFRNCRAFGLYVNAGWEGGEPSAYLKGIEIADCTFKNCSRNYGGGSTGALCIGGLDSALVHDNVIDEDQGYGIKFWMWGGFKRLQLYRNRVSVPQTDPSWGAGCAVELWHLFEDCHLYDNTFNQWTSFVYGSKRTGTSSLVFEHNTIVSPRVDNGKEGVEVNLSDAILRDNYVEQFAKAFYFTMSDSTVVISNVTIARNVVYNTRRQSDCVGVLYSCNSLHRDIRVENNTFDVPFAVRFRAGGEHGRRSQGVDRFYVRNNLLSGATAACRIEGYSGNLVNIEFSHNVYGSSGTRNIDSSQIVVSGLTFTNNLRADPGIAGSGRRPVPYYQPLSMASMVMNWGTDVGLNSAGDKPYVGAYELAPATRLRASLRVSPVRQRVAFVASLRYGRFLQVGGSVDLSGKRASRSLVAGIPDR